MTAPLIIRPFPLEAGHPENHGYVQCSECKCQLRDVGLAVARVPGVPPRCFDVYACNRLKRERVRHESDARGLDVVLLEAETHEAIFALNRVVVGLTKPEARE